MEMEMLLKEIPSAAPGLFWDQQRLVEDQREEMQRLQGLDEETIYRGGYAHWGSNSAFEIPGIRTAAGRSDGSPPSLTGCNSAADGVSRLVVDRTNLSRSPSVDEGSLFRHLIPDYGELDACLSSAAEQQAELGLLRRLRSIHLGDDIDAATTGNVSADPYGIWGALGDVSSSGGLFNERFDESRTSLVQLQHFSPSSSILQTCPSSLGLHGSPTSHPGRVCSAPFNSLNNGGVWAGLRDNQSFGLWEDPFDTTVQTLDAFSTDRNEVVMDLLASHRNSFDSNDLWDVVTPPISPQTVLTDSQPGISHRHQQKGLSPNDCDLHYLTPMRNSQGMNRFSCEDSFIIHQKELPCEVGNNGNLTQMVGGLSSRGAPPLTARILQSPRPYHKPYMMQKFESLADIQGSIPLVAKDQHGCRYLQRIFDEGTEKEKEMIFNEILYRVPELMVNPFGNYLMQKILDVCTEKQRLEVIFILTKNPTDLVKIALNMHGTRALQKLIEVLKNEEETSLVISAIQSSFLNLVTDPNGNHVVQRCLRHFSDEQSKFIFEAAASHCVDIATHRHGCCVLQQCIAHSTGKHQEKLLTEVCRNGFTLAQDAYGNYAVQYILDTKNRSAMETLKSEFKGNYAQLSTQKFSSNVVEKCLRVFEETGKKTIVSELLSASCFDHLMQDPYANYVIQSALLVCKGQLRTSLVDAIRSRSVLRSNPYCKGIFNLVKK